MGTLQRLIEGWSGPSAADWLEKQGRFAKQLLDAGAGLKWTRDGFHERKPVLSFGLDIDTFDVRHARRDRLVAEWLGGNEWKRAFNDKRAGLMYYRKLANGESYWWSS